MNSYDICNCSELSNLNNNYIKTNLITTFSKNILYKKKNIDQCGVILIKNNNNKCLACQEFLIVYQKNSKMWGLPKGHLNEDEKSRGAFLLYRNQNYFYECAMRELEEETGISLENDNKDYTIETFLSNKIFYLIKSNIDPVVNINDTDEISSHKWCTFSKLNNFVQNNICNKTLRDLNLLIMKNNTRNNENNQNDIIVTDKSISCCC
jgi:8-oxo-dGTP pyrophosphatase MutT (NUDIX family)